MERLSLQRDVGRWEICSALSLRGAGSSYCTPPLRREGGASTWLPHQHPLWQAAPNADGADVSETVPFFSPISSANFNPEAEESEGVGGRQAADMK